MSHIPEQVSTVLVVGGSENEARMIHEFLEAVDAPWQVDYAADMQQLSGKGNIGTYIAVLVFNSGTGQGVTVSLGDIAESVPVLVMDRDLYAPHLLQLLTAGASLVLDKDGLDGNTLARGIAFVLQSRKAEKNSRSRERFDLLVHALSSNFINVPLDKIESRITNALALLGEFLEAVSASLYRFDSIQQEVHCIHRWQADGASGSVAPSGKIPVAHLPSWMTTVLHQYPLSMAGEIQGDTATMVASREQFLAAPLRSGGRLIGLLVLEKMTPFPDDGSEMTHLTAEILANVLERREVEKVLVRQECGERFPLDVMQEELIQANSIRYHPMPEQLSRGTNVRIHSLYLPTELVGGDFYDFHILQGSLGVFICDVSGHGVPSALVASMIKIRLQNIVRQESSPAKVLHRLNQELYRKVESHFVTALYAILFPEQGLVRYASAGHLPALLLRGNRITALQTRGGLLGQFPENQLEDRETRLVSGDRLLIYTDGIIESHREREGEGLLQFFGEQRLRLTMLDHGGQPGECFLTHLVAELERFSGGALEQDDITAVVLDMLPV